MTQKFWTFNNQVGTRARSSGIVPLFKPKINQETYNTAQEIRHVLEDKIDDRRSLLAHISQYYFDGKGKALRPRLAINMADAVNTHLEAYRVLASEAAFRDLERRQNEVALTAEMYHTASLYHDDVLDKAELRRMKTSINHKWGQKSAILGGNFVFGASTVVLGKLGDPEVVKAMSQSIHDLVNGELQQLSGKAKDKDDRFNLYIAKTYNKTASLMANSCKAVAHMAAVVGRKNEPLKAQMAVKSAFAFGKNLGIAFQLIDDWLDFSASAEILGKPAAADLKLGLATAPVLFAADQFEELDCLIKRRFRQPGDVDRAFRLVLASNGLEQTQLLAKSYAKEARKSIMNWKESEAKQELIQILNEAVNRTK